MIVVRGLCLALLNLVVSIGGQTVGRTIAIWTEPDYQQADGRGIRCTDCRNKVREPLRGGAAAREHQVIPA
jgi:hypothetical protein